MDGLAARRSQALDAVPPHVVIAVAFGKHAGGEEPGRKEPETEADRRVTAAESRQVQAQAHSDRSRNSPRASSSVVEQPGRLTVASAGRC